MEHVKIIYENSEILIINKPAGLACQGGAKVARSLDKELSEMTGAKIFLAHRLDKETAGLMVAAKSAESAAKWSRMVSSGDVKKEYLAICAGRFEKKTMAMSGAIEAGGAMKSALTFCEALLCGEIDAGDGRAARLSLARLSLGTGRTHQIRIHLARSGHPIVGDDAHGDFALNKVLRKVARADRLMLASTRITLPLDGERKSFETEMPPHMKALLEKFAPRGA